MVVALALVFVAGALLAVVGGAANAAGAPDPGGGRGRSERPAPYRAARPVADDEGADGVAQFRVFRPGAERAFAVEQVGPGAFRVRGEALDRLVARHDLDNEEALAHVEHRLRRLGVIAALEREGFTPGDDVEIGGVVFELDPS